MVVEKIRDPNTCLGADELQAWQTGQLSPEVKAVLILHADGCEACRQRLGAAQLADPALGPADPRAVATAHGEQAPDQQRERPTVEASANQVWSEGQKPGESPYSFLAPPQLPDELGRLGNYRILRVIGEGGMGTVFEAEDPQLQRRVAIKVLRQGLDPTTRKRFLQEARLAASLASERIVTIYHIGEDRSCPYIVMELLQGETLDDRLTRSRKLTLTDALRITREAAEGLAIAHDKGLIHRDIKPANVWLESRAADDHHDRVKLLDFGIARSLTADSRMTEDGLIVGTPSYMCPEQAHGAPLDARSDLFSLGCLIYAMLSGESPFARATTIQSIRAVAEEDAVPIRHKLPQLPPQISTLIHKLLSKHPKDRPGHARHVVDEIRCLEMLVRPTVALPAGMPTALGHEAMLAGLKLGWRGWAGIAAVVLAAVVGLWNRYDHLTRRPDSAAVAKGPKIPAGAASAAGSAESHNAAASAGGPAATVDAPAAGAAAAGAAAAGGALPPIKVGILHSLSGPMATSERAVTDAFLFAVDEINAAGGVLGGRQIEPIVRDGKSYAESFAEQAEALISQDGVATIFGGWRSSCRKSVEEVCRKHDHLLVFPKADEGLEQSPYVIYMGGAPNQQTTPAVKWAYAFLGKRKFFLVGSEGLFSRASHEIIKDELKALGASVVGEQYCPVGDAHFAPIAAQIKQSGADVVLNTVSGSGNIALFKALDDAGLKSDVMPIISYDLTEEELRTLSTRADVLAGNYAAWTYFQSLPDAANQDFIRKFRKRFGPTRSVNDPMAAAYAGMRLWALGVDAAKSDQPADIRRAMLGQKFTAPEGPIAIDPATQRAVRMARIGQIGKDLEFEVVWVSPKPIVPVVFPPSRSRAAWEELVQSLRDRWDWRASPDPQAALEPTEAGEKVNAP